VSNQQTPEAAELYEKRIPIFTRSVKGKFRTFKTSMLLLAYATFFLLPWVPWDRGIPGIQQAIQFDIVGRQFYIFNLLVDIQNIFWLAGVLALFAFGLFFVTAVLGRVFCGYFCFQTIWTDAFMFIESWVQGDRNARKKLYESPWNGEKFAKVGGTWLLWLLFAFWTGFTFTAYWNYAPKLFIDFFTGHAPFAAYMTTLFLTATTFIMAGFAREQVCTFMCPYARFQGVMFDKDTLIVTYDEKRGEGEKGRHKPIRGAREHDERVATGHGDCIDCGLCVHVCPAGIDIRDGVNYKCITCGLCIDACNNMMTSLNYPTGLIRYESERGLEGGKTNYFSPRNIGYFTVICVIIGLLGFSVANRDNAQYKIEPERRALVTLSDSRLQKRYEIKLNNLSLSKQQFFVELEDKDNYELDMPFNGYILESSERISLAASVIAGKGETEDREIGFIVTVKDPATGEVTDQRRVKAIFGN